MANARSQGRAAAAAGKNKNPYRTDFFGERPGDGSPKKQRNYDEWEEGYADKMRELEEEKR